ncbi:MAG: Nif3-like dinuclear metal center hexameric protein [Bacteroidota bacterium]
MTKIRDVVAHLESLAPPMYQESYDNSGLIVGDPQAEVAGVLLCLDSIEAVIDEAIELGCNLVIAHHPIVFKGLKRFTGKNYVERVVIKAIKHDVAIYACHTNLDNVALGVNRRISEMLGLQDLEILAPKSIVQQISFSCPLNQEAEVRSILSEFADEHLPEGVSALGLTLNNQDLDGRLTVQLDLPKHQTPHLRKAVGHLNIPIRVQESTDRYAGIGSGMVGNLKKPTTALAFLKKVKKTMHCGAIRHTALMDTPVTRVAVCGGAGGFLLSAAKHAGAHVFVTADYKYHEFFDADGDLIIADIGHYESEQYTIQLLEDLINQKFRNFAVHLTSINTNPVNYL